MTNPLRKMLTRSTPDLTEATTPLLAGLDDLQISTVSGKNKDKDHESPPPPPEGLTAPSELEPARRSPSRSLLDAYKKHAPGAKPPTIPVATKLRKDDIPDLVTGPTTRGKSTIRTVGGTDFEMLDGSHAAPGAQQRQKSAEPPFAGSATDDDELQYTRRSSRAAVPGKETRADSTAPVNEVSNIIDFADKAAAQKGSAAKDTQSTTTAATGAAPAPRARNTLKKKNPSAARSRSTSRDAPEASGSGSAPKNDKETQSVTEKEAKDAPFTSDDDVDFILEATAGQVAGPTSSSPQDQYRQAPDLVLPPVRVVPPVALASPVFPTQAWTSSLSSTSRPDHAWGWNKRWTCCACGAETIVENSVCARLDCLHRRCVGGCRVIRQADYRT